MQRHIYFDLDGTLTDPFDGITRSIAYALERLGVAAPDAGAMRAFIGPPLQDTFRDLLGEDRAGHALACYRERFADVGWAENAPYPGIHDALDALVRAGRTLFVATTKPTVFAEKIVAYFGMAHYFAAVCGSELDGTRADKTELLGWALPRYSAGCVAAMVGDRKYDIVAGANNGMGTLGVAYGYGSTDELRASGADRVVLRPADLPGALL